MKLSFDKNKKIKEVQEEFNALFPYLKLEFFSKRHRSGEASAKKYMKEINGKKLGDFKLKANDVPIEIHPEMTVANLEESFRKLYGLNVQVFRKSGKVWLETTFTDGWSLEEQNLQGEALSKPVL